MAKQMGNSGRGPKEMDQTSDDREEEQRFAQGGSGKGPLLGEGEKVGEWSTDDEEEEAGVDAASSTDENEEGYQAEASQPSESERPPRGRGSRWGNRDD